MSEELLINITPQETRIAYVENGMLQEVHVERARKRGLVGNIYCGKVNPPTPIVHPVQASSCLTSICLKKTAVKR